MNNRILHRAFVALFTLNSSLLTLLACSPEPPLHLYDAQEADMNLPVIDLDLEVFWNYDVDIDYDWTQEWYYGWDEADRVIFGEMGYTEPTVFNLRRDYTGNEPYAKHTGVIANTVEGNHFLGRYDWGFWDILCWNDIQTLDGVQRLVFDETTSLDSVVSYTNQTMHPSRYQAPRYTHSFYEPELLFSAYEQAIEVNRDLRGFVWDPERNAYVRTLKTMLRPITYIYLTQVILHNNQDPYTIVLIVPNKDALNALAKESGLDPASPAGAEFKLRKIQEEIDSYKKGGLHGGMFPERWLPAAVAVLPEAFTEQNGLVNSTMKVVRGKVEKFYADRIDYAYTAEGKELLNPRNIASV